MLAATSRRHSYIPLVRHHVFVVSLRSRRTCSLHGGCATDRAWRTRVVGLIRYWAWGWCVLAMSGRGSLCRRVHRVGDVEVAYDVHPVPGFTSFTAREMAQSLRDPHVPVVDVASEPLLDGPLLMKPTRTFNWALHAH